MTHDIWVGNVPVKTDLVVFDKDGTLIDFTELWHGLAVQAIENLLQHCNLDLAYADHFYTALGFDPERATSDADGALAVGPNERIYRLVERQLRTFGEGSDRSRQSVAAAFRPVLEASPAASMLRPAGDVQAVFQHLKARGIKIAVATTDIRHSTVATLRHLGVLELIDDLICADDSFRTTKPDPQALIRLASDLDVRPEHVIMVGDTVGDMRMARLTGVCTGIAVLTGAGTREQLKPWADLLIDGIDAIRTAPPTN